MSIYFILCLILSTIKSPVSVMHTTPFTVKPYSYPNPATAQFPPAPVPAINPQLTASIPTGRTPRSKFSSQDIERLICLAAEEEPWAKPHGNITKSWNKILKKLQSEGRFEHSTVTTIRNKVGALLTWQKVNLDFLRRLCQLIYSVRIPIPWKAGIWPPP